MRSAGAACVGVAAACGRTDASGAPRGAAVARAVAEETADAVGADMLREEALAVAVTVDDAPPLLSIIRIASSGVGRSAT